MLICSIFYLVISQTVSAIGVGVTPGDLNFSAQAGAWDTKKLFVINTGTEVSNYKVYVDEDYTDWFDIAPDTFNLSSNEHKEVIIKLTPPLYTKGDFDCVAYVVSSSPSSEFSVGSGIKVPVHATVSNSGIIVVLLLVFIGIGAGGFYFFKRNKNREKVS
jgi:hypothetical protein